MTARAKRIPLFYIIYEFQLPFVVSVNEFGLWRIYLTFHCDGFYFNL
jgi:hypothetical protein